MATHPELQYSLSHEWVNREGKEARIGISNFAQKQLGDLTFIELPAVGTMLSAGQEMGSVESVKAASELYTPVAGEVIDVNTALLDSPELVNQSPYEKGWMIRVRLTEEPEGLMTSDAYHEFITQA